LTERRQAQLLSIIALVLSILFAGAIATYLLIYNGEGIAPILALTAITLVSYLLSRTSMHWVGSYFLTYSFTALAYVRIFLKQVDSFETAVTSTVHVALIFSSLLLSHRSYLILFVLTVLATFSAPLYSSSDLALVARIGGIVLVLGSLLYAAGLYRDSLDRERMAELSEANLELQSAQADLETRIGERTREIQLATLQAQGRANRLQNITDISKAISDSVQMKPDELLARVSRMISEKLGYYHVGIFLLDPQREFAVLKAANSRGGQEMLEKGHQLKVGGAGLVGYVAQTGNVRIARDTGSEAIFFKNPYLPETRSEISLPIRFGATTIGVLDVQSTQSSAFGEEDANALSAIANQLALILHESWQTQNPAENSLMRKNVLNISSHSGYSFTPDGSITDSRDLTHDPFIDRAISTGEIVVVDKTSGRNPVLLVPVRIRDQVIGIIQIESEDAKRNWGEDEILLVQAVSERAGLSLDNAGLLEDATRRAEQEETISRISNQIGASTDFDRIMQTTIQELGLALGTSRAFIQISNDETKGGNGGERS
jgi:GAF domain-containing protein